MFAILAKRGAEEAGSILVRINRLDGTGLLFGPAPGPAYDDRGERRWSPLIAASPVPEGRIVEYLDRAKAIDPDIWIIEIEDRHGSGLLAAAGVGE